MAHAKIIQPSKAARLLACPGSAALEVQCPPQQAGSAADRGAYLHGVAEEWLRTGIRPPADSEDVVDYVEWIQFQATLNDADAHYELTLDISMVTGEVGGAGTADAVLISWREGVLVVADLKTGRVDVSPERNAQLMIYAAAALARFDEFEALSTIRLVIVQPLSGGVKEWECSVADLFAWLGEQKNVFQRVIALHCDPGAVKADDFNPGEEQCRYCPAAQWLKCKALDKAVMETLRDEECAEDVDFEAFAPAFDPADLGAKYRALGLVKAWSAHIEQRMWDELSAGHAIPGFYLGKGKQGNRAWFDEKEVAEKYSFLHTDKVMTPPEAEKQMKAGKITKAQWAEVKTHIVRPEGSLKICQTGDSEPEFNDVNFGDI